MKKRSSVGDIDATYYALRPRMARSGFVGRGTTAPTVVCPPHTHSADQITFEPETTNALIAGDDCQETQEELGTEKLARSGEQPWLGPSPLDMAHFSITNIHDADVEGTATVGEDVVFTGTPTLAKIVDVRMIHFKATAEGEADIDYVRDIDFTSTVVGEGVINSPRVIHMVGDHTDDEAKIDGLERVVFNNEPTASSIELPSRLEMNVGVEAGVDYTAAEGKVSWDTLEDVLILYVASGAGLFAIAVGWGVLMATNGYNPA